jgi:hypothetical protein
MVVLPCVVQKSIRYTAYLLKGWQFISKIFFSCQPISLHGSFALIIINYALIYLDIYISTVAHFKSSICLQ